MTSEVDMHNILALDLISDNMEWGFPQGLGDAIKVIRPTLSQRHTLSQAPLRMEAYQHFITSLEYTVWEYMWEKGRRGWEELRVRGKMEKRRKVEGGWEGERTNRKKMVSSVKKK